MLGPFQTRLEPLRLAEDLAWSRQSDSHARAPHAHQHPEPLTLLDSPTSTSAAILLHTPKPWPAVAGVTTGMISWMASLRAALASRAVP